MTTITPTMDHYRRNGRMGATDLISLIWYVLLTQVMSNLLREFNAVLESIHYIPQPDCIE